ncbi:hypothetical protein EAI_00187 [Harpegnathos saltator]|uniref:Uncharacterized protein n=1 Tax=Harpegnathos saltator TaxID=610380 RepID=E2BP63_HARSA|nr:hypothetical protein EAI_00187 [Harpegnathos saltator]
MVNLIRCNRCFFISYCSEDHKNLHLPQHRKICTAIEKFLKNNPQYLTRRWSYINWWISQRKFQESVQKDLGRELEEYETQMFTFTRSCFICHQHTGLSSCQRCLSIDYCLEHKVEFDQKHERLFCDHLILWLNLELTNFQYESTASLSLKLMKFPDDNTSFDDMEKFMEDYIQDRMGKWDGLDYIYSDYVSEPLSIYYGLYMAKLPDILLFGKGTYVIHVIAANFIERNGLPAWEILLHLCPDIEKLIVIMLGTKLQFEIGIQEICPRCACDKKEFFYECYSMSYSDYMANPSYKSANLVIGLETIYESKFEECSITMKQYQKCPILLIIPKAEKLDIRKKIKEVLGIKKRGLYYNKFESLRPHRVTKFITYRNPSLTVYQTLINTNSTNGTNSTSESSNEESIVISSLWDFSLSY